MTHHPPPTIQIWLCRHCGYTQLRHPGGLPCVRCLNHGWTPPMTYQRPNDSWHIFKEALEEIAGAESGAWGTIAHRALVKATTVPIPAQ